MGKESTAQKELDDFFSNCQISASVKGSNVSIMDMHNSPPLVIRCWKGIRHVYMLVARQSTNSENSFNTSAAFRPFLVGCNP
jgi:hypothetical protein